MNFEKFDRLNSLISVEEVFDFINAVQHKSEGFVYTYECPYHEDASPSLMVDIGSGKFNCFACDCGGSGAYSAAKYYLTMTESTKPGVLKVVDFLSSINREVESIRHLFAVRQTRTYERGVDKKRDFLNRTRYKTPKDMLNAYKTRFNEQQKAMYIDAIMTNMPDEFIITIMGIQNDGKEKKGSEAFSSLLNDDENLLQ